MGIQKPTASARARSISRNAERTRRKSTTDLRPAAAQASGAKPEINDYVDRVDPWDPRGLPQSRIYADDPAERGEAGPGLSSPSLAGSHKRKAGSKRKTFNKTG